MMPLAHTAAEVTKWLQENGFKVNAITEADPEPRAQDPEPVAPPTAAAPTTEPPTTEPPAARPKRHRGWVKLREHVYICPVCGTGRENTQDGNTWFTTWHLPDGTSRVLKHTPPCEPGPRTAAALKKHAAAIAAAKEGKKG